MARITIDFHDDRKDAAAAVSSLAKVGLEPGGIGGAWLSDQTDDIPNDASALDAGAAGQEVQVAGLGRLTLTGWLAQIARQEPRDGGSLPLSIILEGCDADEEMGERIQRTLAAGGGIVGVRASETFDPNPV